MAGAIGLMFWRPSPVLVRVLVLGSLEIWRRWRARRSGADLGYYSIDRRVRVTIGAVYAATAVACLVGMHAAYVVH